MKGRPNMHATSALQSSLARQEPEPLAIPQTPLALEVLDFVTRNADAPLCNHSIRSYLFARLVARERGFVDGRDYDSDLLFCACALHDIGLTRAGDRGHRFEVDGADLAAEMLTRRGLPAAQ
ncbi:MAG TPA: HD domain-containing protein, partial [Polyangiaceae bacterium]